MTDRRSRVAVGLLLVVGLANMTGHLLDWIGWQAGGQAVRAIASASGASPAPKVFSAVQGLETFSTTFRLQWKDRHGALRSCAVTPEVYARVRGPYNRRNIFGAALAYAPILATTKATQSMFEQITRYALTGDAPLLRELGVNPKQIEGSVSILLTPKNPGDVAPGLPLHFRVPE